MGLKRIPDQLAQEAAGTCPQLPTLFSISVQSNKGIPERRHLVGPQNTPQRGARLELGFHLLHKYPVLSSDPLEPEGFKWATGRRRIIKKMGNSKSGFWPKGNSSKRTVFQNRTNLEVRTRVGRPRVHGKKSKFKRSSRLSRMLSLPACDLPRDADRGENLRLFCLPSKPLFLLEFTMSWRLGGVN